MEKTRHTPGPWSVIPGGNRPEVVHTVRFGWGCGCICNVESPNPIQDARLIAAAPDLLEFARAYAETWIAAGGMPLDDASLRDMCRAAIEKAEGR